MFFYETYLFIVVINMFHNSTIVSFSNMLYSYVGVIEEAVHDMKGRKGGYERSGYQNTGNRALRFHEKRNVAGCRKISADSS